MLKKEQSFLLQKFALYHCMVQYHYVPDSIESSLGVWLSGQQINYPVNIMDSFQEVVLSDA